jgi:hypothetical protein
LPIQTSTGAASTRGVSASADFAANKRLPLPDMRGYFVRGSGTNSDGTKSDAFGVKQDDAFKKHSHTYSAATTNQKHDFGSQQNHVGAGSGAITGETGDTETRPKNIALLYCIKF